MANDIEASLKTNTADEVDNDSIETGIDQQQQDESKSFKDLVPQIEIIEFKLIFDAFRHVFRA